ncbi:helix-turn-helix transcriptional regulator [Stappia taiwanensis]|uniref:Helix-turn-helix transcriptional regulator n=1 Tax=Stappia taiwanensis TaxID=992267 RepID=A0A838XZ81_9HYPH|nr:helix-turn-helix transcriptional regulator [Stappia taiwanensis]MBA4612163.1 helix-turn-helix transcriptional regulator [Stappia taiwanensis]GGE93107.1 transcriptional regulator [Stappia taiwanensis]
MLSHESVWCAIDLLARKNGLTPSGLARRAGLDPTTFNPSKRTAGDGRPRWPSMESIAKILSATQADLSEFVALTGSGAEAGDEVAADDLTADGVEDLPLPLPQTVPLLASAEAGAGGFFDDGGYPLGSGWNEVPLPSLRGTGDYALKVTGDGMLPLYRDGDIVVVSPRTKVRRGDRIIIKPHSGELTVRIFQRKTTTLLETRSLDGGAKGDAAKTTIRLSEIDWIARIIWASQ